MRLKVYDINNKKFTIIFLTIFIVLNFIIFSINFLIDPFGDNNLLIEERYKPVVNERSQKYTYIFHKKNYTKYNSYILGSSRVMNINPKFLKQYGNIYNFGIHVGNNAEKLFLLKELIKYKAPVKSIYLGIDFFNFNSSMRQHFLDETHFKDSTFQNYLSFSMFKVSLKTITYKLKQTPQTYLANNGTLIYYQKEHEIQQDNYDFSNEHLKKLSKDYLVNNFIQNNFILDTKVFDILKEIKKLCQEHNIKLYIFITPINNTLKKEFEKHTTISKKILFIKYKLINIFNIIYDFSLKDEENKKNKNFYDIVHYRESLGTKLIKSMHGDFNYGKKLKEGSNAI